jgi:ammonium transporter, Amt family
MNPDTLAVIGALALLVRFGHTLHTMGAVRARNVAAVAARALIGTAMMVLLTYAAGHVLVWMYSDGVTGQTIGPGVYFTSAGSFLSVLAIALVPAALIGGATAERARVRGLAIIAGLLTVIALPAIAAAGWVALASLDRRLPDETYLSSTSLSGVAAVWPVAVAHLLGSAGALTIAKVIGPRAGKYNRDGSANFIPAHSLPTMIAGDLLLFVGLPMMAAAIAGEPAARVVNAMLAASAAVMGAVAACTLREGRVEVMAPWSAAIAGLIAGSLTAPDYPLLSIAVGLAAGLIIPMLSLKADLKFRIDETSGLAMPHLVGALAGLTGAGIGSVLESGGSTLSAALLGSVALGGGVIVAFIGIAATGLPAVLLRKSGMLRVDESAEAEGLDLAQHDINAYPDFQQTMIKSYHLRQ